MPLPDEHLLSTFRYREICYLRGKLDHDTLGATLTSLQRDRVTSSVVTPDYREMIRKRMYLPNNPYYKIQVVLSDPQGIWKSNYVDAASPTYYDDWTLYQNVSSFSALATNVAEADDPSQRAIANLRKQLSETKVNTLVTAAEMHKTADHLAKTAKRIYESVKALRRGDFMGFTSVLGLTSTTVKQRKRFNKRYKAAKSRDAQEHLYGESSTVRRYGTQSHVSDFAADTMLEYSYAWKPLLFDVYGHAQALAEIAYRKSHAIHHVTGRAKTQSVKTVKSTVAIEQHPITRTSNDARWVTYGCAYKLQGGELNTFSQLGIDNPLEVAWELVPGSFVADWFWPIGEYLKSLTATVGLIFYTGYKSERRFVDTQNVVTPNPAYVRGPGRISYYSGPPLKQSYQALSMTRSGLIDFPMTSLPEVRNPFGNGADYGLGKALNAIALLQSLFLRRA